MRRGEKFSQHAVPVTKELHTERHVLKPAEQTCADTKQNDSFNLYQLAYRPIWKNILKQLQWMKTIRMYTYVKGSGRSNVSCFPKINQRSFQNAQKTFYKWCWDLIISNHYSFLYLLPCGFICTFRWTDTVWNSGSMNQWINEVRSRQDSAAGLKMLWKCIKSPERLDHMLQSSKRYTKTAF